MTEFQARNSTTCPACRKQKELGLVVCWECFRRSPTGGEGLKDSGMPLDTWLANGEARRSK